MDKLSPRITPQKTSPYVDLVTSLRHRFLGGVIGTLGLQVAGILLSFLISLVLARLMGAAGYGVYAYAMGWVSLLIVFALAGTDKLLMRKVAAYRTQEAWGLLVGLRRWSDRLTLVASVAIASIMALLAKYFFTQLSDETRIAFWIALLLLPLLTLVRLRQATMIGSEYVVQGQIAEAVLRPFIFLLIVILTRFFLAKQLDSILVMWLQLLAAALVLLLITWSVKKINLDPPFPVQAQSDHQVWLAAAFPIFLSAVLEVANTRTDIIMLGTLDSAEAVGIYNVAKRLTEPMLFVLIAVNMTLAPRVSSLYVQGRMKELQSLVTRTARLALLGAGVIITLIITFSGWLLALWGAEFVSGQAVLLILSGGQLVNVLVGSASLLLLMTGHEREVAIGLGIAAVINISLNFLLIPIWGIVGTAIATSIGIGISHILLGMFVFRRLHLNPTAFAFTD